MQLSLEAYLPFSVVVENISPMFVGGTFFVWRGSRFIIFYSLAPTDRRAKIKL